MFGQRTPRNAAFSGASMAAKPCARFVHESVVRVASEPRACSIRLPDIQCASPALRSRMRSVTVRTRSCNGGGVQDFENPR